MDKKNLVIAFLLGALLMQPAKANYETYMGLQGAEILASAMIKSAKIIGLGARAINNGTFMLLHKIVTTDESDIVEALNKAGMV